MLKLADAFKSDKKLMEGFGERQGIYKSVKDAQLTITDLPAKRYAPQQGISQTLIQGPRLQIPIPDTGICTRAKS